MDLRFKLFFVINSVFLFFSCSVNNKNNLENLSVEYIYAEEYAEELLIRPPHSLDLLSDGLMVSQSNGDGFITFLNKKDMSILLQWGKMGNGPEDFISPQYCGHVKENLYFYDFNLRRMTLLHRDVNDGLRLYKHKKFDNKELYITNLHVLDENYILANVVMGADNPLVLMDGDLNVISGFGSISPKKVSDGKSYVGRFASSGNRFVHAMNDVGYLSCYEQTDGSVSKLWEYYVSEPVFTDDGRLNKKETLDGFWDVKISNGKVYAIYNGKNYDEKKNPDMRFPTTILVFDFSEGKLLNKYVTDRDVCRMAVDNNGLIYGVGTRPEIEIVKYKLPD